MLLTPGDEQLDALADSGPLLAGVLPFTAVLAKYSAAEFVEHVLLDRYSMRELVIGYDHGLGRGRQGDVSTLVELGAR
jgi:riboflavin kinase/FMN adenylyltransferase